MFSTRITVISDHVCEFVLHPLEDQKRECGDRRQRSDRDPDNRPVEGLPEKRTAKAFENTGERVKSKDQPPFLGQYGRGIEDRRGDHPDLQKKGQSELNIAEPDVEGRKKCSQRHSLNDSENKEER